MSGIQGLGQLAVAGRAGPESVDLRGALDHLGLQVDRRTVLAARAVLLQEANELLDMVTLGGGKLDVGQPGGDPVSPEFQAGFAECTRNLMAQIRARADTLIAAGDELETTARRYGYAEDTIKASFTYMRPVERW